MNRVFWFAWLQAILFMLGMLVRNREVYRWHRQTLDRIHAAAVKDLAEGRDPRWRIDALDRDLYRKQIVYFWRGLDSFITPDLKRAMTP